MTTHTELATGKAQTIAADANYIRDLVHDREVRLANATAAGATLAYEVERFLSDPEGVGTDALQAAYVTFLQRHSGGFTDTAMHPGALHATTLRQEPGIGYVWTCTCGVKAEVGKQHLLAEQDAQEHSHSDG